MVSKELPICIHNKSKIMMTKKIPDNILESIYAFRCATYNHNFYLSDDLIIYIYSFIISDYYGNKINKFCINFSKTKKAIQTVLHACLENRTILLIRCENIEALQFLVKANISRKYDLHFWSNMLHILSFRLQLLRFKYTCSHIGLKTLHGKKFILALDLWLKLCKKFNFKILLQTKQSQKYIRAKCIIKMNKYDQNIIAPMIVQPFTNNIIVDLEFARNNLLNLLIAL